MCFTSSFPPSPLPRAVLAKQAEKKAILEKIEQGKRNSRNNKKRAYPPGGSSDGEPLLKRLKSKGGGRLLSATPSPSPMTLASSRPGSVLSTASTGELPLNGNSDDMPVDPPGSNEGSETNLEITSAAGTTPVRKPGKSRLGVFLGASPGANGGKMKRTAAPLGGRGKMQKSTKKAGGGGRSAAASAGAIAGAKAATSAAYAAYGLPPHHISPSPSGGGSQVVLTASGGGGGGGGGGSSHSHSSSPRVSPVPMAFVATSLVTTPPSNKLTTSKAPSSLTFVRNNV